MGITDKILNVVKHPWAKLIEDQSSKSGLQWHKNFHQSKVFSSSKNYNSSLMQRNTTQARKYSSNCSSLTEISHKRVEGKSWALKLQTCIGSGCWIWARSWDPVVPTTVAEATETELASKAERSAWLVSSDVGSSNPSRSRPTSFISSPRSSPLTLGGSWSIGQVSFKLVCSGLLGETAFGWHRLP